MDPFLESGMMFGPYPDGTCFRLETCSVYRKIRDGVPIAEFLLLRERHGSSVVWVVEAKSSSPRPESPERFDDFIDDIRRKLLNGLSLGIASILGRHELEPDELPASLAGLNLSSTEFRLVLAILGHPADWLPPLQDALRAALKETTRTWAIPPGSVVVMNHDYARWYRLIAGVAAELASDSPTASGS